MVAALVGLFGVFVILLVCETLWRHKKISGELARKLVHISVGSFVAFWPWFMPFSTIQLISVGFLIGIILSLKMAIFRTIHSIARPTWGELLYPFAVGLPALLTQDRWVFAAALLHLSLADGLAALVGQKFGVRNRYKVLGYTKSIAGTATFLVVSIFIVGLSLRLGNFDPDVWPLLIWLPIMATAAENVAIRGTDNVVITLLVTVVLNSVLSAGV